MTSVSSAEGTRGDGRLRSPSLVELAADDIRKRILAGDLAPGERLIEERLTDELDISRPPLREALRLLQNEGLVITKPRRGSFVVTLTDQDAYEIVTLRSVLERAAFELGIPVRNPEVLDSARQALDEMQQCADNQDRGGMVLAGYAFHSGLIKIAEHHRLEGTYASVQQQLLWCMARNLIARERFYEDLHEHVERHRHLLQLVESGDRQAALAELAVHGENSFMAASAQRPTGETASATDARRGSTADSPQ